MEKLRENERGITLIALVITVIVLLILAGVTIATLTGESGLLQKATIAKEENEKAKELELIKLAVASAKLAGEGTITKDNLESELKSNFDVDIINLDEKSGGWILNQSKEYTIYEDGKVVEGKLILLPKEYQQVEYVEGSGTQYVDTLLNSKGENFEISIDFQLTKAIHNRWIFGTRSYQAGYYSGKFYTGSRFFIFKRK